MGQITDDTLRSVSAAFLSSRPCLPHVAAFHFLRFLFLLSLIINDQYFTTQHTSIS
uniref:Uncharacterized protein n=1 Tax=Rhizophora mucronata TaxID=61149 RepID=A0A2P2NUA4_RHIMU